MATYAYLRVSTDAQDVENQKHGILEYANAHDLGKVVYIEDNASGKLNWTVSAVKSTSFSCSA